MSASTPGKWGPQWIWSSTVGLKILMAGSGLALVGFVFFHMVGNLQVFLGQLAYNNYAAFMQSLGGLLWVARLGLLALLGVHVASAIRLGQRNIAARPRAYENQKTQATSWHAKLMLHTGIIVLLYIVYHLAHFTIRVVPPAYNPAIVDANGNPDLYGYFVESFSNLGIVIVYVVANVAIASHLAHATTSMFYTLGVAVGPYRRPIRMVGPIVGAVVGFGNVLMPVACYLGIVSAGA